MKQEVSAGGIVFRKRDGRLDVLLITDSYGKPAFPKGHVEKGETIEEAALRETKEEVNLEDLKIITKIGVTKFWFTAGGERVHKTLHLFLMESEDPAAEPSPQYEIQGCEWVPIEEFIKVKTYKNLEPMIKKAVKLIYQQKV